MRVQTGAGRRVLSQGASASRSCVCGHASSRFQCVCVFASLSSPEHPCIMSAARSLKQQRSRLEPIGHDEVVTFVSRAVAEIENQRPDKMSRREGPPSDGGWSDYSVLNSPSSAASDPRRDPGAPRGPPPPQPVNGPCAGYADRGAPRGPPTPQPVNGPRGSARHGHPAPHSPAYLRPLQPYVGV